MNYESEAKLIIVMKHSIKYWWILRVAISGVGLYLYIATLTYHTKFMVTITEITIVEDQYLLPYRYIIVKCNPIRSCNVKLRCRITWHIHIYTKLSTHSSWILNEIYKFYSGTGLIAYNVYPYS